MPLTDIKTRNYVPLTLILVVAIVIRLLLFWQDKVIAADGISYVTISKAIFDHFDFSSTAHYPPFYPLLIGILIKITPYDELAGKIVSTIMGSLLIVPLYMLGKELYSKKAGYIAAILGALSPILVLISGIVLSQSTYITLLITALYICWKAFHVNSRKMACAAGLFFAASYLTRPEAIIIFFGISAVFVLIRPVDITRKDSLGLLLIAWAAFFVAAFPYILLLHKVYGTWQLTGKSSVTLADSLGWYLNRPDMKRYPSFSSLTYLDIVKNYPDFLWKNALKNIPALWAELHPHIWLLALLGVVSTGIQGEKRRRLLFLGAALLPLVVIIFFFWIDSHYFSPCLPILYMFCAQGLITIETGLNSIMNRFDLKKTLKFSGWALILGIGIALVEIKPLIHFAPDPPYHFSQDGARYDHKLIGLMLKNYLPPKARVMAKSGRIVFYGDFQHVDIPQSGLEDILQTGSKNKARYLVADGTLFASRPQLEPFLIPLMTPGEKLLISGQQTQPFPGGLRLIFLYKDPASVGVAVYEFPAS